jgi:hypothetical protein
MNSSEDIECDLAAMGTNLSEDEMRRWWGMWRLAMRHILLVNFV